MASFPERLKMLRLRAGLKQQHLADKLGFSVGAVGNWESGLNMPSRAAMRKIALLLGTTEIFLSGESDIDSNVFVEQSPEYRGTLRFSEMTLQELEYLFDSRQKELASAEINQERRRELLGSIADLANELKKRIPRDNEKASSSSVEEIAKEGLSLAVNDAKKRPVKQPTADKSSTTSGGQP